MYRRSQLLLLFFLATTVVARSRFSIVDTTIGGVLSAKRIQNDDTGEYIETIVDYGGRVEDLVLNSQATGVQRKVLLTHNNNASAVVENKWWKGMLLLPWANRIAYGKYTFFNDTYQLPLNENTTDPPRHNALHGLMHGKKMTVDGSEITDSHATLQLSYHFKDPIPGYPFTFIVYINYTLSSSGFRMNFTVTNLMESEPMPFYMGWHPYFVCTAYKAYVVLNKCTAWNHVELNSNMDPTGITKLYHGLNGSHPIGGTESKPTFYDDEFKPAKPSGCDIIETTLYDQPTGQTMVLWQDSNFRLVHIFTGSEGDFGEDAIAMEPMSGMTDAYNNHDHLTVLSGGETWTGSVGIYIE